MFSIERVITEDETWVYHYNPETKRQSMAWKTVDEPRPTKARMNKSQGKAMLITFFDCHGLILKHWVPPGQTVNALYYIEVLKLLRRKILWEVNSWILHHDNALAHAALLTRQFLASHSTTVLEHPPYKV